MRINTKCSLALHILIVIAVFSESHKMTSEAIARSTGSNPVIIRNILSYLKKAGIIDIKRGGGGAVLKLDPAEISVWKVYTAIDPTMLQELIGLHPNPSSQCPLGREIYALLREPYDAIRESVRETMLNYTLADLLTNYYKSSNEPNKEG